MARRKRGRDVDGILLLDKPRGISSNDALQQAKRLFGARKAGHTGNLDVQADGLLPVCMGEATKVCQFLLDSDKRYVAQFTLGVRTTTGDCEGATLTTSSIAGISLDDVENSLSSFVGVSEQLPPMHSALKRNGQPLYKLARQGLEVEREKRTIHIYTIILKSMENQYVTADILCSKGTYIRTLATDLGDKLGCGAHVSALRRERVGVFDVKDAWTLEQLEVLGRSGLEALDTTLLFPDQALMFLPAVELTAAAANHLLCGQPVSLPSTPSSGLLRLYATGEGFIGLGEILEDGRVAPRRIFHLGPRLGREISTTESVYFL